MRILLLHPEDSPRNGPWSRQNWDLIIDMGKSSRFSEVAWASHHGCRFVRSDFFRQGVADAKRVRDIFALGRGRIVDEEGIDWWDLISLLVAPQAFLLLQLKAVAADIHPRADLWATRRGESVRMLEIILNRTIRSYGESRFARSVARTIHYAGLLRRFSAAQLKEIILDKYDSGYRWRSRFAARQSRSPQSVVLLPSAYGNVSRMAAAYARLLPDQLFLMIATRQSGKRFTPPANVRVRDLAAYAMFDLPEGELTSLVDRWRGLKSELRDCPEMRILIETGVLDSLPIRIRDGLGARNAWREVLTVEPVKGVLCGDDSNLYTRLPVLLAAHRNIPTVDFHHGALDGRYVLKDLPCNLYLAKNQMERDYLLRVCELPAENVVIGAPPAGESAARMPLSSAGASAIFFSEPYESAGMRVEEVYRELLPPLCRIARENGRSVVLKLHPFESRSQRRKIVREVLSPDDEKTVNVIDGPLTSELMAKAWFGITVESTTVIDCQQSGVPCFLCGWLSLSPYEYAKQYARFGIGEVLEDAKQVWEIPARVEKLRNRPMAQPDLSPTVDPTVLRRWLTVSHEPSKAKSVS